MYRLWFAVSTHIQNCQTPKQRNRNGKSKSCFFLQQNNCTLMCHAPECRAEIIDLRSTLHRVASPFINLFMRLARYRNREIVFLCVTCFLGAFSDLDLFCEFLMRRVCFVPRLKSPRLRSNFPSAFLLLSYHNVLYFKASDDADTSIDFTLSVWLCRNINRKKPHISGDIQPIVAA